MKTIAEFLKELRRIRRDGARFILMGRCIRSTEECCPINEIAYRLDIDGICVHENGRLLGLRSRDVTAIMDAADDRECRLRTRLLKACGL